MLGQLRNEIGKRGVTSSSDAAADEELVAAAKNGDELGFESLAKRHQRRIFVLAFRYTRVREDAEDIVQETFRKAFAYLQKEEARIVSAAIRHLRPGMRRAVELRELGDLSTQETARRMGLSVAAIKGRVFHARKELGRALRYHAVSLEGRS